MSVHTSEDPIAHLRERATDLAGHPPAGLQTGAQRAAWTSGYHSAIQDLLTGRLIDHTPPKEER